LRRSRIAAVSAIMAVAFLSACSTGPARSMGADSNVAFLTDLPTQVKNADERVQQAYRYALIEADLLTNVPCYCGCVAIGHRSNDDCYVGRYDSSGQPEFDLHALGCGVCVDITHDAVQLKDEGKSVAAIQQAIDQTYSRYGPPTILSAD